MGPSRMPGGCGGGDSGPLTTTSDALAETTLTGAQLADFCNTSLTDTSNPADDWKQTSCVMFIYGFTSAHGLVNNLQADDHHPAEFKPLYCASKVTGIDQYETVFRAYAIANPTQLNQPAENSLFAAFSVAFPCDWLLQRLRAPQ